MAFYGNFKIGLISFNPAIVALFGFLECRGVRTSTTAATQWRRPYDFS